MINLGDVRWARGDRAGAERIYRRVAATYPNRDEAIDRLRRAHEQDLRWQLDVGLSFSDFSRAPRNDWYEGLVHGPRTIEHPRVLFQAMKLRNFLRQSEICEHSLDPA